MRKILLIIFLLLIPTVLAGNYGIGRYGLGLYGIGEEAVAEEEIIYEGGAEAGTDIRASEVTMMTKELCELSKGFAWYNGTCYECDGSIIEEEGILYCALCPKDFMLIDGECKAEIEKKIPIITYFIFAFMILIAIAIITKKTRKQKKKLIKKLTKEVEKEEKKSGEPVS